MEKLVQETVVLLERQKALRGLNYLSLMNRRKRTKEWRKSNSISRKTKQNKTTNFSLITPKLNKLHNLYMNRKEKDKNKHQVK